MLKTKWMKLRYIKIEIIGFADRLKVRVGMEMKYSLASGFWLE